MAAQDIAYVELYVGDDRSAVEYFETSFGFTRAAESVGLGIRSTLLRHGAVQLIVTAGPVTEEFLEAHGDGVADIAFGCDDAAQTCDEALAAGASVVRSGAGRPVVSGLFGARHTLVTRSAEALLPAGRTWTPLPGALAPASGHVQLLDHVAVCVESGTLAESANFYINGFGLTRYSSEYTEIGEQGMDAIIVRSPSGGVIFTILEQDMTKKPGQLGGFLSRNGGPGVQHLAFGVDSITSAVREFRDRGIEFLPTPRVYYDMLATRLSGIAAEIEDLRETDVLADCDEWGYLLQLFTRSPYIRNTLFYELIERRGARGFGAANVKALYAAVELDGLTG
jgi:4-hydroxymandelate synthase